MNDYYMNLSAGAAWWLIFHDFSILHHDIQGCLNNLYVSGRWQSYDLMCKWILNNILKYGNPLGKNVRQFD